MIPQRPHPGKLLVILLALLALACQLPQAAIPAPTQPDTTQTPTQVSTQAPAIIPPVSSPNPTARFTPLPQAVKHRISTHRVYGIAGFYDRQAAQSFTPRGVNYALVIPVLDHYEDHLFAVGFYDHDRVKADFLALSEEGYNTVRVLLDGCGTGEGCLGDPDGQGLNAAYLDNIVDLMHIAKEANMFLLIGISDLPQAGGYQDLASQGADASLAAGRNAGLLTRQGIQAAQDFWYDLLAGLIARQAPTDIVLGWELLAEPYYQADDAPFSLETGKIKPANEHTYDLAKAEQKQALAVDGMRYYISQVRQAITAYDPTALVTMGFLAPDAPHAWREGDARYVETAALLNDAELDFYDLHASPGLGLSLAEVVQNFGLEGHVTKPILMGDVGASTWAYPEAGSGAIAVQDWIAGSCAAGVSGWLYNGYYPDPAGLLDATWGFVDAQGSLLKALSPKNQPDPCLTTVLPGRNLALGKDVSVTASLPDQAPQMAVDGSLETQWSSGGFPMQWIQVDLGEAYTVGEIRLMVGMWPAGKAVHQVWVGERRDALQLVYEFSEEYYDYDVISFAPPKQLAKVRYVRVVTTDSPSWVSWREIEVLAPFPNAPTPVPTSTP